MSDTDSPNLFDPFGLLRVFAPQNLNQPILPGLFGVTINETNSSAPDTEQKILSKDSYGRQLGKLLDAVAELIKAQENGESDAPEAYEELLKLKERVDQAKLDAAHDRLKRIIDDLTLLKARKSQDYRTVVEGLEAFIKADAAAKVRERMRHTL